MTADGDEPPPFTWDALVPSVAHPMRVAVIEALRWIELPLSALDLVNLFESEGVGLADASYFLRTLADSEIVAVAREQRAGGSVEKLYALAPRRGTKPA